MRPWMNALRTSAKRSRPVFERLAEGVKRACGAWKGRVTPVNNGHSSPPVSPKKLPVTWGHVP